MFDFIFQNKAGKYQSYMDTISIDTKKLQLSKLAISKAVSMISHAIAKSEFIVQRENGREKDHIYWLLNVRPNPNETATDFWVEVVEKLLMEKECILLYVGKHFYIAESATTNDNVMMPQTYSNITIKANDKTITLDRMFTANEVIHLKAKNEKIKEHLNKVLEIYDGIASSAASAKKISNSVKFKFKTPAQIPLIRKKNADGSEKTLTVDDLKNQIKEAIESDNIELIQESFGIEIDQLQMPSNVTTEDITKMANEIYTECALAFDIPKAVFLGEITEKADSTNEFITYAVGWIVEIINDSLNAKLVGEEDYLKGEYIWIDMSRYKHVDIIESADKLDKLRSIGYNFDEIRTITGWEPLNTKFSQERAVTKNYTNDLAGGGENEGDEND